MDTTIITMKRPVKTLPYFFESAQGSVLYGELIPLRERAPGFMGLSVERSEDDMTIIYRMNWSSPGERIAFVRSNSELVEQINIELQEYNLLNGIVRRQSSVRNV